MCRVCLHDIPERFAMEVDDRIKETVAQRRKEEFADSEIILDQAKGYLTGRYETIQTITRFGDPSSEILSEAELLKADIIAVGCRGLKGIRGMLGSVSHNILSMENHLC
jgi:nucleotide-binding universal stress UspA family protein